MATRATAKYQIAAEDKASESLRRIKRNFGGVDKSAIALKRSLIGLVSVGTVTWLANSTKRALEFADSIAKTADRVGLSTKALQELRFAAERTGASAGTLDMAMQRFGRRLAEADAGSGVLKDTLAQLNIPLRDTAGNLRSTEDVLNDYADAIQNAKDPQIQLGLAFKAFDSEGAKLVNTLRNGSIGLNDLRQSAQDAGAVMDTSLIRKSEVINDRWDTLSDTIGTKFKAALVSAADASLNFLKVYNDLESTLWAIVEAEERLLDAQERVENQHGRNKQAAKSAREQAKEDLKTLREQEAEFRRMEESIARLRDSGGYNAAMFGGDGQNPLGKPDAEEKDIKDDPEIVYGLKINEELIRLENQKNYEIWLSRVKHEKSYSAFLKKSKQDQLGTVLGSLTQMTQGVAQHNKAMFNINKIAGIGEAIVNTYVGASRALAMYPPPLSFAMAAAQVAAGMAQVSAIKSTSFDGGGAPSLAGSGGATPTIAVDQYGATQEPETVSPQTTVEVNIQGGIHDTNSVRDLIEAINEEVGDGVNLTANIY